MVLAPRRIALHVALALHAAIGTALLAGVAVLDDAQDDLFALCILSMWLAACLLPFVVAGR